MLVVSLGVILWQVNLLKSLPEDSEFSEINPNDLIQEDQFYEMATDQEVIETTNQQQLNLKKLQKKNSDTIAVITFDNQIINLPVMQANNDYYLNHGFNKQSSKGGMPYTKNAIIDQNVIIYGHTSTKSETYFTPLNYYKNQQYYLDHPAFSLETQNGKAVYEIFSVFLFDESKDTDYDFLLYDFGENYNEIITRYKNKSLYPTQGNPVNENIVTLITCNKTNLKQRIIMMAYLKEQ